MNEEEKENRKFQFDLTKAQVDFEFWFALSIGMLAIGYGLLSYFKDNLLGLIVIDGLLLFVFAFLIRIHHIKEDRFKDIKRRYIETSSLSEDKSEKKTENPTK
jgi:hypothetical protein